jgi:hypothetical protein
LPYFFIVRQLSKLESSGKAMESESNLLLLSTSTLHGQNYLEYIRPQLAEFLGGCQSQRVYFAPYAQLDYAAYTARVQQGLAPPDNMHNKDRYYIW